MDLIALAGDAVEFVSTAKTKQQLGSQDQDQKVLAQNKVRCDWDHEKSTLTKTLIFGLVPLVIIVIIIFTKRLFTIPVFIATPLTGIAFAMWGYLFIMGYFVWPYDTYKINNAKSNSAMQKYCPNIALDNLPSDQEKDKK